MAIQQSPTTGAPATRQGGSTNLAEVISVILDKGIVIDAWARVSVIGIEILTVEARAVVASVDTYLRYAEAIGQTALASKPGTGQASSSGQGDQGQQQLPDQGKVMGYLEDHPEGVKLGDLQAYFDAPREEMANVVNNLVQENKAREDQNTNTYYPEDQGQQQQQGQQQG